MATPTHSNKSSEKSNPQFTFIYAAQFKKEIDKLEPQLKQRIGRKLKEITEHSDPISLSKPLAGTFKGLSRWRIGPYRIIFRVKLKNKIEILSIQHRRSVYE